MKKVIALFLTVSLTIAFGSFSIWASESIDNVNYDEDCGMYFIEFTVPKDVEENFPRVMQQHLETVGVVFEPTAGREVVSQGNYLTAVAQSTSNKNFTVTIQLKVKGFLNLYYNVSGSQRTMACDGQTHVLYDAFEVEAGKTYRFYYNTNGTTTDFCDINMTAVFFD